MVVVGGRGDGSGERVGGGMVSSLLTTLIAAPHLDSLSAILG